MLIPKTESAETLILPIKDWTAGGSIALVGDPGTFAVTLRQPAVEDPDKDTVTDWMDVVYDGVTQKLDASNTILPIPDRATYLLSKEASTGKSFGVELN